MGTMLAFKVHYDDRDSFEEVSEEKWIDVWIREKRKNDVTVWYIL